MLSVLCAFASLREILLSTNLVENPKKEIILSERMPIMSDARKGRCLSLSPARRMVMEILHHGRKVPALPLSKVMRVGQLAAARKAGAFVSWTALFMKAYSLVAERHAELRRAYIRWPWPHLYEHPVSACALLLERDHQGESIVLGAKIHAPETQTLTQIDERMARFRDAPLHEVGDFRRWLRVGRLPGFVRRFLFWHTLNLSGFKRAKRLGTFAISSLGSLGVEQHHPISPLTTYLTFGPINPLGEVNVKIIYDHRVMDGCCVARCLNDLEETLNTRILAELQSMIPGKKAAESLLLTAPAFIKEPVSATGV
jgi:hypothetical protein